MFQKYILPFIRTVIREIKFKIKPIKPSRYKTQWHKRRYLKKLKKYKFWRDKLIGKFLTIIWCILLITVCYKHSYTVLLTLNIWFFHLNNLSINYEWMIIQYHVYSITNVKLNFDTSYFKPHLKVIIVLFEEIKQFNLLMNCNISEFKVFFYKTIVSGDIKNYCNFTIVVYLTTTLLYVLIGGSIPLFERKYLSLIQRRVGPKFVGYNGRLQILADALKLLFKELIILKNTNPYVFIVLPINTLIINLFLCHTIVWHGSIYTLYVQYTLFILILIELLTTILVTYIGLITKNKYTLLTSVRIINGTVVFEIFITSVLSYFYLLHSTTSLLNTYHLPLVTWKIIYFWIISGFLLHFILLVLKKVPFDIIEAETELIMGYTSEHSGFLSGALILVEYLHLFFWVYFLISVFFI